MSIMNQPTVLTLPAVSLGRFPLSRPILTTLGDSNLQILLRTKQPLSLARTQAAKDTVCYPCCKRPYFCEPVLFQNGHVS